MPTKLLYTFLFYFVILTAQGNVLAVYEHKHAEGENGTFTLAEQHLYGASRIGMTKPNLALNTTTPKAPVPTIHYELTNHLGNVMAVITDEPAATETPAVESLTDYYPFGMTMPGRSYNAHTLRHGFTGHEKESDLAEGIYTTEYRLYDARVGRWLSVDPLFEKYVSMSPYNYCMLNPLVMVDPDGRDAEVIGTGTEEDPYIVTAKYYYTKNGEYEISDDAINGLKSAVAQYNNNGKTWECGPKKNKIYVKFDLQLEEVEDKPNYKVSKHQFTSNGELFLSGNFVSTETTKYDDGTYAMGSASFNSININVSRISEDAKKNGFTKEELFESTFVHEIGHNLGLEEEVGGITIRPEIKSDKDFGTVKILPNVTKRGVQEIMNRLDKRTHDQCKNDGVGVIRTKK